MFVVCVTIQTRPEKFAAFRELVIKQADNSVTLEPGCHRFDVCGAEDGEGGEVFLYELYTDAAAFAAHLESDHFKSFDRAAAPMIEEKTVKTYNWVRGGAENT